jgi:hypothetical protein
MSAEPSSEMLETQNVLAKAAALLVEASFPETLH